MALVTGERRNATVRAATPVRVLSVDSDAFKSIVIANPDLATEISQILGRRQVEIDAKRTEIDEAIRAAREEEASREIWRRIGKWFGLKHGNGA